MCTLRRRKWGLKACRALARQSWPGNIRQLENLVRNLVCAHRGPLVDVSHLSLDCCDAAPADSPHAADLNSPCCDISLPFAEAKRRVVRQFEVSYLTAVLKKTRGNITAAAKLAGKDRRAFFQLISKHGIVAQQFRGE